MPAVTPVVGEKAPRELVILVLHEDAHASRLARPVAHILLPDDGQEQRTRGVHDCDIRQQPVAIILLKQLNRSQEEWVLRHGAHGIVRDTGGRRATNPRGIGQKRIQATVATLGYVSRERTSKAPMARTSSRSMYVPP